MRWPDDSILVEARRVVLTIAVLVLVGLTWRVQPPQPLPLQVTAAPVYAPLVATAAIEPIFPVNSQQRSPVNVTLVANVSGGVPPYRYAWDLGDGNTTSGSGTITYRYPEAGAYIVQLVVTDRRGTVSTSTVHVKDYELYTGTGVWSVAQPAFGPSPLRVTFTQIGSDTYTAAYPVAYAWEFGDGSNGSGNPANHTFQQPGTYVARLHAVFSDNSSANYSMTVIAVGPAPLQAVADARGFVCLRNITLGSLWAFVLHLAGGASPFIYSWDFGDGTNTSSLASPSHSYTPTGFLVGLFTTNATVTDANGQVATAAVSLDNLPASCPLGPWVSASVNLRAASPGQLLFFHGEDGGGGANFSVRWDFGDGSHADTANATHGYAREGTFNATFTMQTSFENVSAHVAIAISYIRATTAASALTAQVGDALWFSVHATGGAGGPYSAIWDFGDGNVTAGLNVTHRFTAPGPYRPVVVIEDASGTNATVQLAAVTITAPQTAANGAWIPYAGAAALLAAGGIVALVALRRSRRNR